MKFKGVENNSIIREIGSLFRRHDGSDWHINVKLAPDQNKQYFGVSQIPILARRRVVNASKQPSPAGFQSRIVIENTRHWSTEPIEACPIPVVNRQDDGQQWCFNFEFGGTQYYLPQLELARVLFFHHAYITRLSLISGGLLQDFDIQCLDSSRALINVLPSCTLPEYVRADHALRRLLAWILLDQEARQSFESIARYQLVYGYNTDRYRLWRFQFEPPSLAGVELILRGHYHPQLKANFVYEIYGIANLICDCPAYVDFFDPQFAERQNIQGRAVRPSSQSSLELDVDDEHEPNSEHTEIRIESPAVTFKFDNPVQTTRIGKGKGQMGCMGQGGVSLDTLDNSNLEVSTDEAGTWGSLRSADYDCLDDRSEDAHLYAGKFEAFDAMVLQVVRKSGFQNIHREIRKLPSISGYSKHLLTDGNPRCIAFYLIKKDTHVYALIEADTSDNKKNLSTLLLEQPSYPFDWERIISYLEINLIRNSLAWPTSFLKQIFGINFKRVFHQRTQSTKNEAVLEQECIQRWAERAYSEIFKSEKLFL